MNCVIIFINAIFPFTGNCIVLCSRQCQAWRFKFRLFAFYKPKSANFYVSIFQWSTVIFFTVIRTGQCYRTRIYLKIAIFCTNRKVLRYIFPSFITNNCRACHFYRIIPGVCSCCACSQSGYSKILAVHCKNSFFQSAYRVRRSIISFGITLSFYGYWKSVSRRPIRYRKFSRGYLGRIIIIRIRCAPVPSKRIILFARINNASGYAKCNAFSVCKPIAAYRYLRIGQWCTVIWLAVCCGSKSQGPLPDFQINLFGIYFKLRRYDFSSCILYNVVACHAYRVCSCICPRCSCLKSAYRKFLSVYLKFQLAVLHRKRFISIFYRFKASNTLFCSAI